MSESTIQLVSIILSNFLIILWFRKESRDDWKRCDDQILSIREDIREWNRKFYDETKDFHNRLCKIEERRLKDK